ncbi:MAG: hypothetical protein WAP52_02350, partial [Candidatus Sungiibacteriota bacterium]
IKFLNDARYAKHTTIEFWQFIILIKITKTTNWTIWLGFVIIAIFWYIAIMAREKNSWCP